MAGKQAGAIRVCAIGFAVAVVIYPITTGFKRRYTRAKLTGCPAGLEAGATARCAAILGSAFDTSEAFVDITVAVIVVTIADFDSKTTEVAA